MKSSSKEKKVVKKYLPMAVLLTIVVALIGSCINYLFPQKLKEVNIEREVAFQVIRPHLLKYKEKNGKFPCTLAELVPDYVEEIPDVLLPNDKNTGAFELSYYGCSGDGAHFIYHTTRGPDSRREYNVQTGNFVSDM